MYASFVGEGAVPVSHERGFYACLFLTRLLSLIGEGPVYVPFMHAVSHWRGSHVCMLLTRLLSLFGEAPIRVSPSMVRLICISLIDEGPVYVSLVSEAPMCIFYACLPLTRVLCISPSLARLLCVSLVGEASVYVCHWRGSSTSLAWVRALCLSVTRLLYMSNIGQAFMLVLDHGQGSCVYVVSVCCPLARRLICVSVIGKASMPACLSSARLKGLSVLGEVSMPASYQ